MEYLPEGQCFFKSVLGGIFTAVMGHHGRGSVHYHDREHGGRQIWY